jgi:hypothetical protein
MPIDRKGNSPFPADLTGRVTNSPFLLKTDSKTDLCILLTDSSGNSPPPADSLPHIW